MALDTSLISVTIVYCKNGKRWQKEIDLGKAGGLWWDRPNAGSNGNNYVPGKATQLPEPCGTEVKGGGGSACWWDNQKNEWVCPDGLGG